MICLQSLALLAVSWPQFRLREEEEARAWHTPSLVKDARLFDSCMHVQWKDVNGEPGSAQWPDELAASLRKADSLLHVG